MRITFWGAAETVTGSRFVVETGSTRLLVDRGIGHGLGWEAHVPASGDSIGAKCA